MNDRTEIKNRLPDLLFVVLKKRDQLAYAVSVAMSNQTGVTQCNSLTSQRVLHSRVIDVSDDTLLACYKSVQDHVQFRRNWLHSEPHSNAWFESLTEDLVQPLEVIFGFLRTLRTNRTLDVPLRRLNHRQLEEDILRLNALVKKRILAGFCHMNR